jgi:SAM-dependent methyltransferase
LPGCTDPAKGLHHRLCPNYSRAQQLERALALTPAELRLIRAAGGLRAATYGEVTPDGFRTIFDGHLDATDRFVDLGSGNGRLVLQAAREYGVAAAIGIELSSSRHELALAALEEAAALDASLAERCTYMCDDCAGDVAAEVLRNATVVWLGNLCFGPELQARVAARLEGALTVRFVGVIKPFAVVPSGYELDGASVLVQASWTHAADHPGQRMFRYRRVNPGQAWFKRHSVVDKGL